MLIGILVAMALSLPVADVGATAATGAGDPPADHNLNATLSLNHATLPQGEAATLRLRLDADSLLVEDGAILNRNDGAWTCSFVFRNTATGKAFVRPPYDAGMPPTCTRERFSVIGTTPLIEEMTVHLLSRDGEQIPPGRYQVHARYENIGVVGGHDHPDPRFHPDAARLWTGRLETVPVIVDIKAAQPEPIELSIPRRVTYKLLMDVSQIAVHWDDFSTQSTTVTRRPGYTVGHRYRANVLVDGTENEFHPSGQGGTTWSTSGTAFMLPPEISKRVFTGAGLELVIAFEVFETSAPAGHDWLPEAGDFKVLWRGEIGGSYR